MLLIDDLVADSEIQEIALKWVENKVHTRIKVCSSS